eukprot:CAMPEP_0185570412 /NCGR_PEP_ID=MMETSP0434-20130131/2735_1 /TAXON_ID=626734 ORGANISM="Favella taraikaensis, Strain Fe Narragansett Bay" /NCGR_SAMPLE_ID=MMETSP0434 /ASSEMBLY_ACC=CAM_ASM_000379 /LENGTH=82 /DNA_ID=CAMNT_0028185529 /DNA_START=164 /DNA_END=412 /DNA_ORIENTATION=-
MAPPSVAIVTLAIISTTIEASAIILQVEPMLAHIALICLSVACLAPVDPLAASHALPLLVVEEIHGRLARAATVNSRVDEAI